MVTYVRNIDTPTRTCIYTGMDFFFCERSKGGREAPSATKQKQQNNKIEGAAAAKWVRTYVIYIPTCVYIPVWSISFSLCAEQGRKQAPSATTKSRQ